MYFDQVGRAPQIESGPYVDIKRGWPTTSLVKVESREHAQSVLRRACHFDPELVEYSLRLPLDLKMKRLTRKVVLRRAMRNRLPRTVLKRRKRGFNAPVSDWLRGSLRPIAEDLLSVPSSIVDVQHREVQRAWRDHVTGDADHGFRLWSLVILLLWEREVYKQTSRLSLPR